MSAPFNFGDLVSVSGYYPRVFKVDGYHIDTWRYPGEEWTETVYELVDAFTGDWIEADADDLTLVVTADKADEYVASNPAPAESESFSIDLSGLIFGMGAETMSGYGNGKQERKPTARELSAKEAEERKAARKVKAEEIDNLLDMRNWYADQFAKTANVEDNERVLALDCKLKELAEKE